jgi:hypothetical protein
LPLSIDAFVSTLAELFPDQETGLNFAWQSLNKLPWLMK